MSDLNEQRRLAGLPEVVERKASGDVWERVVKACEDAEKELKFPKAEWNAIIRIKKLLESRKEQVKQLTRDKDIDGAVGRQLDGLWGTFQNAIVALNTLSDRINDADNDLLHLSSDASRSIAARPASDVPWEAD